MFIPPISRPYVAPRFQPLYRPANVAAPARRPEVAPAGQTLPSGSDLLMSALVFGGLALAIWMMRPESEEEKAWHRRKRASATTHRNPRSRRHPKFDPPARRNSTNRLDALYYEALAADQAYSKVLKRHRATRWGSKGDRIPEVRKAYERKVEADKAWSEAYQAASH